jgi:hypothetical protein
VRVHVTRAFLQIWESLEEHGLHKAAWLISIALFMVKLPPGFWTKQALTIVMLNDRVIQSLPPGKSHQLFDPKGRHRFDRRHTRSGTGSGACDSRYLGNRIPDCEWDVD